MLQELLNLGLLEIGDDDSRFTKVAAAATAFEILLADRPSDIVLCTLFLLDHELGADSALFQEIEELIVSKWPTFKNAHVDQPKALLRSILISALANVVDADQAFARIVSHAARGRLRSGQYRLGKEADLVQLVLQRAFDSAEASAVESGELPPIGAKNRRRQSVAKSYSFEPALTKKLLLRSVATAAAPEYPPGSALEGSNPHLPDQGQPWVNEFIPRMADALAVGINKGNESLAKDLLGLIEALEKRLTHSGSLPQNQKEGRLRLNVLWWSEALYSTTFRCGYRELPPIVAVVTMAFDLSQIVPSNAPISVSYILSESVTKLTTGGQAFVPLPILSSLLGEVKNNGTKLVEVVESGTQAKPSPLTLLEFCQELLYADLDLTETMVRDRTNIDPNIHLSYGDFAMWIFSNIQAKRVIEELS